MNRTQRLEHLKIYIDNLNRDVSDLPRNFNRFIISGEAEYGYSIKFTFTDTLTGEQETYRARWQPLVTKDKKIYIGFDVFDKFNTFVINRMANKDVTILDTKSQNLLHDIQSKVKGQKHE